MPDTTDRPPSGPLGMTHPALVILPWEHTEEDAQGVHGTAGIGLQRRVDDGPVFHFIRCYCGWDTGDCGSDREAFDALVTHAIKAMAWAELNEDVATVPPIWTAHLDDMRSTWWDELKRCLERADAAKTVGPAWDEVGIDWDARVTEAAQTLTGQR